MTPRTALPAVAAAAALCAVTRYAAAETATYAVEPSHTFVYFEALRHYNTSTVRGRFDKTKGTVAFDAAAKTGQADITIDMSSVSTGVTGLDAHLKKPDFFNAGDMPTASFVGDKFAFDGDKVKSVAGTLTLLGKAQPVTLTADNFNCYDNPMIKRQVCGGDFQATIQRSRFGMGYGVDKGLPDNIHLLIQIEAIRQ